MGKKKDKQLRKRQKRLRKLAKLQGPPKDCKARCCKKYKKGETKRCKKCPCFDLLKELEKGDALKRVA